MWTISHLVAANDIGSGCVSVGRAVASNTRGLQFKFSHRQIFYWTLLFTVNCIEKIKIKKKKPGMAHFFKKTANDSQTNESPLEFHINYTI